MSNNPTNPIPPASAVPVAPVPTFDEARQILCRFNASHFNISGQEKARYSIPADHKRDDDLRLAAFINWAEEQSAHVAAVSRARVEEAKAAQAEFFKQSTRSLLDDRDRREAQLRREADERGAECDRLKADREKLAAVAKEMDAMLERCFIYLGEQIKRLSLNESAANGTQDLSRDVAVLLDKHRQAITRHNEAMKEQKEP